MLFWYATTNAEAVESSTRRLLPKARVSDNALAGWCQELVIVLEYCHVKNGTQIG